jgi:prevent-host-death family protein
VAIKISFAHLRDNLATVLDTAGDGHEVVIVRRRGSPDVALIPADELA